MSYLCKNCINNNHGWCKALKRNKLKEIDKCAMKDDGSKPIELRPFEEFTTIDASSYPSQEEVDNKINTESYRVLGKREMLWNIQKQALAIKNDSKLDESTKFNILCDCINSIAYMQEFSEKLYKVEDIIDSEVDKWMIEDSKAIRIIL